MSEPKYRVAISGFGGLDNPEPGTPVARALRLGLPGSLTIEALGYDPWITGAYSPGLVDRIHLTVPLARGDDAVLARLLAIHAASPFDVLMPCLDLEIFVYARLAERLAHAGIRTLLPGAEQVARVTKAALPLFCYANAIATPRTVLVTNVEDVPFHADQFGYPVMVKGLVAGAARADSRDDAYAEAMRLRDLWGGGVLLQEVIDGDEYNAAMVARGDGTCLGLVTLRKLGVNWRGKSMIGAVVRDPDLAHEARRILNALRWRGPLELEFIRSHKDQRLYLIEMNNRFPNWILLSHWAGSNLPAALVRHAMGLRPRGRLRTRPGTAYVRDVEEIVVPEGTVEALSRFGSAAVASCAARRRARRARPRARVAVTGISAFHEVAPGLGVARALRQASEVAAVYGLGQSAYDTGAYRADLFDAVFGMPAVGEPEPLLARIREIQSKTGLDLIIPCTDIDVATFVGLRETLARMGIRTLLPSREALASVDKHRALPRWGGRRDWGAFCVPETVVVRTTDAMSRSALAIGFPLVLKGGSAPPQTVYSRYSAEAAWRRLRQKGQRDVLVQRHIAGEEFAVSVVCDAQHRVVASTAIKKLKQCERGKTWAARVVPLPDVVASLDAMTREIGWCGPLEAEFIRDVFRERLSLLEINPRFPAWIGFSADAGVNLPRQAVRVALGDQPEIGNDDREALFMRNCREVPVTTVTLAAFVTNGMITHA
ncbi:MAG: hypothetical protein FJZ38_21380 [Candidatus Rokubacteria bacterium]|nr:hypothetical protein [Candidatus Rokubacteria bacterium]